MDFVDLIVEVHDHLEAGRIGHAFGGALAFGYVAEPRGTVDIDVNVFLPEDELSRVVEALAPMGYRPPAEDERLPIAGIRFEHSEEPFPLDVFPSLHERYVEVERRSVRHRFGRDGRVLPFLSPEDLCVFKLSFGRPKDWLDLAAVADAGVDLDMDYVETQLVALRGPTMYPEIARLRALLRARSS
jgi:hypothetical protein